EHRRQAGAALDQPAGGERRLAEQRQAVALAHGALLAPHVQGPAHRRAGHQLQGAALMPAEPRDVRDALAGLLELLAQRTAAAEAAGRPRGLAGRRHLEAEARLDAEKRVAPGSRAVDLGPDRIVPAAEEAAVGPAAAERLGAAGEAPGQHDVGRDVAL